MATKTTIESLTVALQKVSDYNERLLNENIMLKHVIEEKDREIMYSVSQAKHNALKKENERLKELLSEDLAAENAKLKARIDELTKLLSEVIEYLTPYNDYDYELIEMTNKALGRSQ